MKPASIKKFDLFYLGSIVVGLIGFALSYGALLNQTNAEMAAAGAEGMGEATLMGGLIVGVLFSVGLWFLISVWRIEVIKWVLALFVAWSVISLAMGLSAGFTLTTTMIIGLVSTLMSIVSIYFLFQPDAKAWFEEDRGEHDPE